MAEVIELTLLADAPGKGAVEVLLWNWCTGFFVVIAGGCDEDELIADANGWVIEAVELISFMKYKNLFLKSRRRNETAACNFGV